MLKAVKGIGSLDGLINSKGIYSVPVSNQLSQLQQLQNLYPHFKDLNYQSLTQSPNPNLFQFNQQSPQSGSKLGASHFTPNTTQNQPIQSQKVSGQSSM